jgi:hypothetical protein
MERLIHVIYVSSTVSASAEHDALKFLGQARTANRKHDVSGLMLFVGGHFLQLLEGEPARVDVVCSTIFRDKRDMRMILRESIPERQFPEWTMGFEAVQPAEVCRLLDESTLPGSVAKFANIDPVSAKTLLTIFGRRRWQADRAGMFRAIREVS